MHAHKILVPALLLLAAAGCKEDTAPNTPGEFGEACVAGANDDTPDGCVAGTECYKGYCEEFCSQDSDCQPVDGFEHTCVSGLCQIWCGEDDSCPQNLGTPLTCGVMGSAMWCKSSDES